VIGGPPYGGPPTCRGPTTAVSTTAMESDSRCISFIRSYAVPQPLSALEISQHSRRKLSLSFTQSCHLAHQATNSAN